MTIELFQAVHQFVRKVSRLKAEQQTDSGNSKNLEVVIVVPQEVSDNAPAIL